MEKLCSIKIKTLLSRWRFLVMKMIQISIKMMKNNLKANQ